MDSANMGQSVEEGSDGISLTGQEEEKMSSITTSCPPAVSAWYSEGSGYSLPYRLGYWSLGPIRGISLGMWDPGNL